MLTCSECGTSYKKGHKCKSDQIVMNEFVFSELMTGREIEWTKPTYTLIPDSNAILKIQVATFGGSTDSKATDELHE